ncbi:MAG: hypothetical protein HYZ81_19300 [Nitrospinae bacterium]|nr:hypothetical protein [Nitrospinota bacterium]
MNRLLAHYGVDVPHPQVSGAEHLEMLHIRDRLAELEPTLTSEAQTALAEADRVLVQQAPACSQKLLRFLDLAAHRREHGIPAARWWWYLDVLSDVPPLKDEASDEGHPSPRGS